MRCYGNRMFSVTYCRVNGDTTYDPATKAPTIIATKNATNAPRHLLRDKCSGYI